MSGGLEAAILALQEGRLDEGLALLDAAGPELQAAFDAAFALIPPDADAVYNAGVGLHGRGRMAEALACFDRALAFQPEHLPALANRAMILVQQDRHAEALLAFEAARRLAPGHPVLLRGQVEALIGLGRWAEALPLAGELAAASPDDAEAWNRLGAARTHVHDLEGALAAFDRALSLDPAKADAAYNRGNVLRDLGRFEAALGAYDQAIALGDAVNAPINKALVLMLLGDYERGLPLYETRWRSAQAGVQQPLDPALWHGRARLAGKRLLMRAEQGFGDAIQMLRYVPVAAAAGAKVLVQVPAPLAELARSAPGVEGVWTTEEAAPRAEIVCPMMSLPLLLGRRPDAPGPSAYLRAEPERWEIWARRLGPRASRRIGLAWSGSAAHVNDRNRSLPGAALGPLLGIGAEFVSLQAVYREGDRGWLTSSGVRDVAGHLADFADTAGLIEDLDLVIAVDTAVAHLAGAMGKPVWILLPFVPDFRWGLGRSDTPLYPGARLFRQPGPRDWEAVIAKVASALRSI
jgi:tetratricopeptide (TPR) repeat protein